MIEAPKIPYRDRRSDEAPVSDHITDGTAAADEGRGAQFEAAIIRDGLTRDLRKETRRVLPVVLPGRSVDEIPVFLRAHSTTHFIVSEFTTAGVFDLLAALSGVSAHPQPSRGAYVGPTFDSSTARTPAGARESTLLTLALKPVVRGADLQLTGVDLNGVYYGNSIVHRCVNFCSDARSPIEYNLSRSFSTFESVVGVPDDAADAAQSGYFQVFLDGQAQPQVEARLGQPGKIRYDVADVLSHTARTRSTIPCLLGRWLRSVAGPTCRHLPGATRPCTASADTLAVGVVHTARQRCARREAVPRMARARAHSSQVSAFGRRTLVSNRAGELDDT
ncbi:NPCBM/NEW2 domain-containing protein [Nocardia brasiliensis]|uniref:NPCBM/NEW2 domain-containing protein n=1 Tax=Nocardia brasiliensis TaxID=37326 RepID=UPI002457EC08|nr:NPCBM/NEW2 domain-containing protein [Nocardia brasiliensis]